MSEENSLCKARSALGDVTNVTNLAAKRGFSTISGYSGFKSGDESNCNAENNVDGSNSVKQVCPPGDSTQKEYFLAGSVVSDHDRVKRPCVSRPCSAISSLRGNILAGISEVPTESKEEPKSVDDSLDNSQGVAVTYGVVEVAGDASRDSHVSDVLTPASAFNEVCLDGGSDYHKDEGVVSEVAQNDSQPEQIVTSVCTNEDNDVGVDNLDSSKLESTTEYFRFPESQESRSTGLEKCVGLMGDSCSNPTVGFDLIKVCSCPFCTKAAYIWSDLHYQDMKGRISALKKSQKDASILVQKSCRNQGIDKHGQGTSNPFSKMESGLMGHWKSLFLHTEDIFGRECNQLEASLITLKDLRDNCKAELELITGMPLEEH